MTERPLLTIAQVVEQFDLSRATVRRGIERGRFNGAHKDRQGRWLVPVESLIAEGVKPRKTWLKEVATEHAHEGAQTAHDTLKPLQDKVATELAHRDNELAQSAARITSLEAELVAEKRLREAAERNADDLRIALRMIESKPTTSVQLQPAEKHRKRWWHRASN